MNPDETNARKKIFQATWELIGEGKLEHQITIREIAARAGVNLALVNYYYQSKENLLSQVVATMMVNLVEQSNQTDPSETDALTRLRNMLSVTANAAFSYRNICRIAISLELKAGCENSCKLVMPLLQEIVPEASESDLHIIALQLMLPFHHILLKPEFYNSYLDTDFFDEQKRSQTINRMTESLLAARLGLGRQ